MELPMIHTNDEEREFLDAYDKYFQDLKKMHLEACPPAAHLYRYYNKELSKKEMQFIEEHIDLCPVCLAALEKLQAVEKNASLEVALPENWHEIEKTMDQNFYSYLDSALQPEKTILKRAERTNYFDLLRQKWGQFWNVVLTPPRLAYAGALIFLAIVSLYSFTYFNRSNYFNLAQIELERQKVVRERTEAPTDLSEGIRLFGDGNYERAIIKLKTYLKENPYNYTANFNLGIAYLFSAEAGLPGLSYKFDNLRVDEGIKYLDNAQSLSGDNQFYLEDCFWYLGKAYLMKEQADAAKVQFGNIIKLSQPNLMRKQDAQDMILRIEKLKNRNN
jgi:tetratricopeptide (TPR) repeat protein